MSRVSARLLALVQGRTSRSKKADRLMLAVAALTFLIGFGLALENLPSLDEPNWGLLGLVAVIGVPLTVATNAGEYLLSAQLLGYRVAPQAALRVSLLAAAANLLPLPGAVLVRTQAIRKLGARTGVALGVSTLVGVVWLATSGSLTGLFLVLYGRWLPGTVCIVVASVLFALSMHMFSHLGAGATGPMAARLIAVEIASVAVKGARLYLILRSLGYDVQPEQAMALAMAAVISTASGFFPAGLGATEILSAIVAPLVDLPAAIGLVAAAIDRLIGLGILALASGIVLIFPSEEDDEPPAGMTATGPSSSSPPV